MSRAGNGGVPAKRRVKHLSNERRRRVHFKPSRQMRRTCEIPALWAFDGTRPYQPDGPDAAHNPKVAGSNPAPATQKALEMRAVSLP